MNLINNKYYITRSGDFAIDGNKKILYSLFSIGLCLEEYFTRQSTDCFNIMIGSTFVWTLIEFFLYITNTRKIKSMYITNYNGKQLKIHKSISLFLQGFQEGGVVTTIGMYFGDRLYETNYLIMYHFFILFIIINMAKKQKHETAVLSKRQVNTLSSMLIMSYITLYNIRNMLLYPSHFFRQCKMLFSMIYISSIWTIIAYYKGFRKVEVHEKEGDHFIVKPSNMLDAFYILGYDVLFEIGIAYLTFYNWFII